jgi:hypothetical protein
MDPDPNVWISVAAAVCGGLAGLAVAALVRSVRARRRLGEKLEAARREVSDARALNAALTGELEHLVGVRLPTLVDDIAREQRSVHVPGLRHAELRGTPAGDAHEAVVRLVGEAVGGVRQSVSRAVLASLRDMLDEPQTMLAATQKRLLTEMDRQPDASAYVEGLMGLDHLVTRCLHGVQRMESSPVPGPACSGRTARYPTSWRGRGAGSTPTGGWPTATSRPPERYGWRGGSPSRWRSR